MTSPAAASAQPYQNAAQNAQSGKPCSAVRFIETPNLAARLRATAIFAIIPQPQFSKSRSWPTRAQERVENRLRKDGLLITTQHGTRQHPLINAEHQAQVRMLAALRRLGATLDEG